ncbi:hypothetical protein ISS07_06675 [Candidatus Woesearchaeota archaeon]|nr:hypothetical protein [Candidatus Woesearchaeota archaeon]
MQKLLHVKINGKLRERMQFLIDSGLFNNKGEIVREGLRDMFSRYTNSEERKK